MQEIKSTEFVNVYEDETKSKLIRCIPVADIGYSAIIARGDDLKSALTAHAQISVIDFIAKNADEDFIPYYEFRATPADPAYNNRHQA